MWQIRWLFEAGLNSGTVLAILPLVCGGGAAVELDAVVADQVEPTRQRIVEEIELLGTPAAAADRAAGARPASWPTVAASLRLTSRVLGAAVGSISHEPGFP